MPTETYKVRDMRRKDRFTIDDEYLNGYARLCGWKASLVYMSLCRHVDRAQKCFPGIDLIAEQHAISRDTVIRALKELENWQIVKIEKGARNERGTFRTNVYVLLDKSQWKPKPSRSQQHGEDVNQVADSNSAARSSKSLTATCPSRSQQPIQVAHSDPKDTHSKETHSKELSSDEEREPSALERAKGPRSSYGDPTINAMIDALKQKTGLPGLDGSVKRNRWYAKHLTGAITKVYEQKGVAQPTGAEIIRGFDTLLDAALSDEFHASNATSMKYLHDNFYKILARAGRIRSHIVTI